MIRVKKKKKNKEREALSLKKTCTVCGTVLIKDSRENVLVTGCRFRYDFCSLSCFVRWMNAKTKD